MSNHESILKKEIPLPSIKIPEWLEELLATACIGSFIIVPVVMAVLAMYHHSIDYTGFKYQRIYEYQLHPFSTFTGIAAIICAMLHRKDIGIKLGEWLRRNRTYCIFLVLIVWIILSTFVNGTNYITRYGAEYLGEPLFSVIKYFLILFPAAALIRKDILRKILLRSFILMSCLLVIAAFYLWRMQVDSVFISGWVPAFTSLYTNTNYYGYFLSVSVPASAMLVVVETKLSWKVVSCISLVANTVALSYNNTMGAWVGCFFASIFMLIVFKIRDGKVSLAVRISFYIFIFTFIAVGLANGNLAMNILSLFFDVTYLMDDPLSQEALHAGSGRWIIWIHTLEQIAQHPLFGIGHEGVIVRDISEIVGNNRPHNEYLQYALFYGIPAGILYFTGCFSVYLRALMEKAKLDDLTLTALVAAFGYLVGAFFGLTLYSTTPYLFIMMGLGYVHVADTQI